MRHLLMATTLLIVPATAFAGGPNCAVGPARLAAATPETTPDPSAPSVPLPAPVDPQAQAARTAPEAWKAAGPGSAAPPPAAGEKPLSAESIAAVPALKRLASAGATLLDLGTAHGMRTIFAKKDNAFQVFYVVPDGSAVIGGIMWDAGGHDVTRDQVAVIPGVVPTVRIAPDRAPRTAAPAANQQGSDSLRLVREATYGTLGSPDAPALWMFVDPFCSFSLRAMQQLQPYVQAGKVRLAVIPVSVLDYEDQDRSTPAAKLMVGRPKNEMVADWVGGHLAGAPSDNATPLLARNMAIASALHLRGTPTLIWQATNGSPGRADGIPSDLDAVIASIGR